MLSLEKLGKKGQSKLQQFTVIRRLVSYLFENFVHSFRWVHLVTLSAVQCKHAALLALSALE